MGAYAAEEKNGNKYRALFNTQLGLIGAASSVILTSEMSGNFEKNRIVHGIVAGGVTLGALCDMKIQPWGALVLGTTGGLLTTLSVTYIAPMLEMRFNVNDTCDCLSLHGFCALLSVLASVFAFLVPENAVF